MRTPLLTLAVTCAALAAPLSLHSQAQSQTAAAAGNPGPARVIVKYKADSTLMRMQALSVGGQHTERAQALGQRIGMPLRAGAGVAERTQVVFASGMTSEQLAQRLSAEGDIEYAVPDQRRRRLVAPNDSFYTTGPAVGVGSGGPVSGQWYLRAPAGEVKSSLDVETAWNLTLGSPNIVVAVLDTGVRFDHPDLKTVALGGNLLPGYDMVDDLDVANDGGRRDADPSDPGDWLTAAEVNQAGGPFFQCSNQAEDSSWHGTQTSGLIAALTNNGAGIASVGRNVRVLPVRVLGKCGGFDSDIVAGMRWAAGLAVAGVPNNPNPARVLNLSLGGEGACTALYRDAVAEINGVGATVIASAGNSAGHAVSSPANCTGVIAVTGLRHVGTKVGFSDLGPEISISAPGGNCVLTGNTDPCLFPIITTSNSGLTTPVTTANGAIYTDAFNITLGTSFSAPLVAGTAALVLSVQPTLTPAELRNVLRSTARPFPTTGGTAGTLACAAPQPIGAAQIDQGECYCTNTTCGAGMLDAGAAVSAAVAAPQARIGVSPSTVQAGQTVSFSAATSLVPTGRAIAAYQWTLTNGGGIVPSLIGATNGVTAAAMPSAAGTFSVSVTVTDNSGAQSTATSTVTVAAAPAPPPPPPPAASSGGDGGGGGALGFFWLALLLTALLALRRATAARNTCTTR